MMIKQSEDTHWYLLTNEGHVLAGPFEHKSEAILAELELAEWLAHKAAQALDSAR